MHIRLARCQMLQGELWGTLRRFLNPCKLWLKAAVAVQYAADPCV